jgi:hypothetical protein
MASSSDGQGDGIRSHRTPQADWSSGRDQKVVLTAGRRGKETMREGRKKSREADDDDKAIVVIRLSGSRYEDNRRALEAVREKTGDPHWMKPRHWIWHHTGDNGTVQLIPLELHGSLPHTGGFTKYPVQDWIAPPRRLGASIFPIQDSYPAISSKKLERFEELLETRLPEAYRAFLLEWNGGRPRVNGFRGETDRDEVLDYFLGIAQGEKDDIVAFLSLYEDRLAPGLLPIAYDAFGNLICLGLLPPIEGELLFWDHELEPESGEPDLSNVTRIAPTFEAFLKCFFDD